ncbi:unnamed protein product [Caenorhabditis angaria]|uniref:Uncharacterized protein n=1 Tax=Caenorhabditis angaria TaxID=860376 RepID=A0A9P1ILP5_9PELO|nr:unnamed protein product [Caenorhabditis angaria]
MFELEFYELSAAKESSDAAEQQAETKLAADNEAIVDQTAKEIGPLSDRVNLNLTTLIKGIFAFCSMSNKLRYRRRRLSKIILTNLPKFTNRAICYQFTTDKSIGRQKKQILKLAIEINEHFDQYEQFKVFEQQFKVIVQESTSLLINMNNSKWMSNNSKLLFKNRHRYQYEQFKVDEQQFKVIVQESTSLLINMNNSKWMSNNSKLLFKNRHRYQYEQFKVDEQQFKVIVQESTSLLINMNNSKCSSNNSKLLFKNRHRYQYEQFKVFEQQFKVIVQESTSLLINMNNSKWMSNNSKLLFKNRHRYQYEQFKVDEQQFKVIVQESTSLLRDSLQIYHGYSAIWTFIIVFDFSTI